MCNIHYTTLSIRLELPFWKIGPTGRTIREWTVTPHQHQVTGIVTWVVEMHKVVVLLVVLLAVPESEKWMTDRRKQIHTCNDILVWSSSIVDQQTL